MLSGVKESLVVDFTKFTAEISSKMQSLQQESKSETRNMCKHESHPHKHNHLS